MTDDIAVVKPLYATEEAYNMGYDRFEGVADEEEDIIWDFHHFTETAEYANNVAPDLRAMAGHADSGPGTYTINRKVAAIKEGCEEDEPAEAALIDARHVFEELVDAYRKGATDAAHGRERELPELSL